MEIIIVIFQKKKSLTSKFAGKFKHYYQLNLKMKVSI